ncbi:MAG: hypothetical protein ACK56F_05015 [bacterium]
MLLRDLNLVLALDQGPVHALKHAFLHNFLIGLQRLQQRLQVLLREEYLSGALLDAVVLASVQRQQRDQVLRCFLLHVDMLRPQQLHTGIES